MTQSDTIYHQTGSTNNREAQFLLSQPERGSPYPPFRGKGGDVYIFLPTEQTLLDWKDDGWWYDNKWNLPKSGPTITKAYYYNQHSEGGKITNKNFKKHVRFFFTSFQHGTNIYHTTTESWIYSSFIFHFIHLSFFSLNFFQFHFPYFQFFHLICSNFSFF